MGEIKSAWEIAREKADKLGGLSPEEQRKQREDRCRLIGKSLAERYLDGQDIRYLTDGLNEYDSQDKDSIGQSALHRLTEMIDLGNDCILDKISSAISHLAKNEAAVKTLDSIKELFQEYQQVEEGERQDIDRIGREALQQLRISGTAVGLINVRAGQEWQERLGGKVHPFEERLSQLKQELSECLTACKR